MKTLTAEWVAKAEEDLSVAAGRLRRKRVPANSICFHCQQSAEKLLKAVLQEQAAAFGKTHDLEELLRLCAKASPALSLLATYCQLLSDYAVRYRYPGVNATRKQTRYAVSAARRIRLVVLGLLP